MKFIVRFLIKVATVIALFYIMNYFGRDVTVSSTWAAVKVVLVLMILNSFIRPVLEFFALPITCLTLGLFSLVISAAMVILTSKLVTGFSINGWLNALIFSLGFSFISSAVEKFIVEE